MRKAVLILLLFSLIHSVLGQQRQSDPHKTIPAFFDEIKNKTKKSKSLWNQDLYGAILLVDPQTREVFANEPDSSGILKPKGKIYTGILPDNINIANTSIDWSRKRWAMIMLPLPQNKQDRINLLAHELFHSAQSSLGFPASNPENNHLDQKESRIYLRLEMEALKKAVQASSEIELKRHLTNALTFRKYRFLVYPDAKASENLLELNEGIAEYTGVILSGRNNKQMEEFFIKGINSFLTNPTFVRSFAYQTIPVYGYLLSKKNKTWNREITPNSNLTDYFIRAFSLRITSDLKENVESLYNDYNGKIIIKEETTREENNKRIIADFKRKFIDEPHFEIKFEKMNVSFDPRNIIPLEDKGTVYPNIRVTDLWGILNVENGALMSPNWDKISITNPVRTEGNKIVGDGWVLELADGYILEKDEKSGHIKIIKK